MSNNIKKIILIIFLFVFGLNGKLSAEVLSEIEIQGNKRKFPQRLGKRCK